MSPTQRNILIGSVAVIAIAATAVAASYFTRNTIEAQNPPAPQQQAHSTPPARNAKLAHRYQPTAQQQTTTQQLPPCNDHNVVGTVGGGVAGAVVGNQFGGGSGKTLATLPGQRGGPILVTNISPRAVRPAGS